MNKGKVLGRVIFFIVRDLVTELHMLVMVLALIFMNVVWLGMLADLAPWSVPAECTLLVTQPLCITAHAKTSAHSLLSASGV